MSGESWSFSLLADADGRAGPIPCPGVRESWPQRHGLGRVGDLVVTLTWPEVEPAMVVWTWESWQTDQLSDHPDPDPKL